MMKLPILLCAEKLES